MKKAVFCFSMDDVGLYGYSTEKHLENVLDLLDELDLKGTFFVVPRSEGEVMSDRSGYVDVIKRALAEGHEIAQHGVEHSRFECGIPPQCVLDLPHEGPTREKLKNERDEIEKLHTVEKLREMLNEGRDILQEIDGVDIKGFRAPSGAFCENLHTAQDSEGYVYDSSLIMQVAAWDLINTNEITPREVSRNVYNTMQEPQLDIKVLPIIAEYTWYLPDEKYDIALNLAKQDFLNCMNGGFPFVPVSHVSPIQENDNGNGFRLYRELVTYAREEAENAGYEFVSTTMLDACAMTEMATA